MNKTAKTILTMLISIVSLILLCCGGTIALAMYSATLPPEIKTKNIVGNLAVSNLPTFSIKLHCFNTDMLSVNDKALDKSQVSGICSERGYKVNLNDGINDFTIHTLSQNGKSATVKFQISFDKTKYDKQKEEANREAREKAVLGAKIAIAETVNESIPEEQETGITTSLDETKTVNASIATAPEDTLYRVLEVVDGDTIKVETLGTLRLIGIDTPETKDPRKPVQCFGQEASNKATELLKDKKVRLEFDESQGRMDKYGRTLAYVFREDGLFFNKEMIVQGFAHEYTYNTPYKYQKEFKQAQESASSNKIGQWGTVCSCEGEKGKEVSRSCTACNSSTVIRKSWDCSTYNVDESDGSCSNKCPVVYTAPTSQPATSSYACNCNKTCSNMSSCAEAQFQLNSCGCSARDGDNDGIACDTQCQ
jgi:endonuclease YncB( thermonuclease family)